MRKLFVLAAAIVLASCSKDAGEELSLRKSIAVDPTITRATEVDFETGDAIGLNIVTKEGVHATNAKMVFGGEIFTAAQTLEWYEDAGLEATLTAYYPYAESEPAEFTITTDQTGEGYYASDLMMARKEGVTPTVQAVDMTFYHKMTKLVINVKNDYDATVTGVTLYNVVPTAAISVENQTAEAKSGVEAVAVKAREVEAGEKYAAIIAPQTVALKVVLTTVKDGKTETFTQSLAEAALQGGGQYSMTITVLPSELDVELGDEIIDWEDKGELKPEEGGNEEPEEEVFAEYEGYFVYHGETYKTVTLADGNTWMAENLRYIPEGKSVSSDPVEDAGIWYPAANAEKVADPELVATLGLLYDAATAYGVEAITVENAATFEGTQGICPEGWHIPTVTEMTGLVGHCSNSALINTEGAYYDDTIKGASIAALGEAGFPWSFASTRNKTSTAKAGSYLVTDYNDVYGVMSYLIGSSWYQTKTNDDGSISNVQYYYLMPLYNASNEKVSVAYGNFLSGASLRCVKDKQ